MRTAAKPPTGRASSANSVAANPSTAPRPVNPARAASSARQVVRQEAGDRQRGEADEQVVGADPEGPAGQRPQHAPYRERFHAHQQSQPRPATGSSRDQTTADITVTSGSNSGDGQYHGRDEQNQQWQHPILRVRLADGKQPER